MASATTSTTPATKPLLTCGAAIYFDGTSSARNSVTIEADANGVQIKAANHHMLDEWSYAELRRQSAPDGVLRLGRSGETLLARLEVRETVMIAAIEDRAASL